MSSSATVRVGRLFRLLSAATALVTFLLIVLGSTVRVTGSGLGCPDWPLCHGQIIPPIEIHTLIEYSHRLVTTLVTLGVLSTAAVATIKYRANKGIWLGSLLAILLLVVQIVLGGITVLFELPPTVVAIHLGNAMLLFASTLTVAALAWRSGTVSDIQKIRSPSFNLVIVSAIAVFVLILSGSVVVGTGASSACSSWPLCGENFLPADWMQVIHMAHRVLAAAAGLLVLYTFFLASNSGNRTVAIVGLVGGILFLAQVLVGALNVWFQFPPLLAALHVAFAAAVWGSIVILAICVYPIQPEAVQAGDVPPTQAKKSLRASAGDYFALTKPWIVALLITTTFGAMLIAARGLPPLSILFLTLFGGVCAAGGANALNSYIDRDIDKVMGRTSRRPLPNGRIAPRRALIFALTLCAFSVAILGFGVNWLAATLSTIGIIYYAFIYTVLLKRATPQNIVIGGAAGAIPPLVGWAAVTDQLSLLSLYLFAIILLWTPPHTWALMLMVEKDYRRVGIPMLPAAWGELETRRHIILYSIMLVIVTVMPFTFGGAGVLYLLGAVALGAYFLFLAYQLWRASDAPKPIALKLYRFSNAYLALLFLALVLDAVMFKV